MSTTTAETITDTQLDIRPLQPTIGAEIHGMDIGRPIIPEICDAIRAAVLQYKVVFFRDQPLDNARFDKRQAKVKVKPGEAYHSDTSWR